ncbi:MAG: outer membrane beta-barrel protein [Bacteroides sp.]|nr:outer membrane beta-barrel protein [Bacteroides sp.]
MATICANASPYKAIGLVADSIGEPEAFATVRIYAQSDSSKIASLGVTNDDGSFSLALDKSGSYILKVFSVGRSVVARQFSVSSSKPVADLGTIIVRSDENMLGEVTVTAIRPLVSKEIDRIGYDVQADEESKTTTLDEMLRKVPLVSVDADGTIKVKGSSDFKIYKNGRPNNSFTRNAKDIFKAIPASMIKKIEVITDPGAREDAEGVGAILNIVTLESTSIRGVMGNVSLNYNTGSGAFTPNFWGSSQIDKVTMSLYAGYNPITRRGSRNKSESTGTYEDSGNRQISSSEGNNKGYATWFGADASYELDSLNLFTLEFGGFAYGVNTHSSGVTSLLSNTGSTLYSYRSTDIIDPMRYIDINGSFNYQHSTHRKGEHYILSYQLSTTNQRNKSTSEYSDMINMPVPYTGIYSNSRLMFVEHTVQFDWTRVFAKIHTLDIGAKYINRNNHSRTQQNYLDYKDEPLLDFTHLTHVAAAYADYRVTLGRFGLRGGLRYEFSRLVAEYADDNHPSFSSNLSDLVPNAAVSYSFNPMNTLKLSFDTRINRPGIDYLNPTVSETPTVTSQGNPDLGSARNTSLNLNYSLIGQMFNLDFTAGYTFTNNAIVQVQTVNNDHIYNSYANAGHNKRFSAGLFFQIAAGRRTNIMVNSNLAYDHFSNSSLDITHGGWSSHTFLRLSQKLPWKLQANLSLSLWTGNVGGLYNTTRPEGISALDYGLSLQRSFLKEDRLTVRLSTWDPIYPRYGRYKSTSFNSSYHSVSRSYQYQPFNIQISVSYRFGSLNASVKKTSRSISNDDVIGQSSAAGSGSSNTGAQ